MSVIPKILACSLLSEYGGMETRVLISNPSICYCLITTSLVNYMTKIMVCVSNQEQKLRNDSLAEISLAIKAPHVTNLKTRLEHL